MSSKNSAADHDVLPGDWAGRAPPPEPERVVKGMIVRKGIGLLSGRERAGKTYIALDMAVAVMSAQPFAGHTIKERCGVLYIAVERPDDVYRRLKHACDVRRLAWDERLPFWRAISCPKLTDPKEVVKLVTRARAIGDEMRKKFGVRLGLIVIDTMVVAAQWKDENQTNEIRAANAAMRQLSDACEAFVLGVDHMGKDTSKGTRGASDKEASMDMVLHLVKETMTLHKNSYGVQGKPIGYSLAKAVTGKDRDHAPTTQCSVTWSGASAAQVSRPAHTDTLFDVLDLSLKKHKRNHGGQDVVKLETVRKAFAAEGEFKTASSRRSAFKRVLDAAVEKGELEMINGYIGYAKSPI